MVRAAAVVPRIVDRDKLLRRFGSACGLAAPRPAAARGTRPLSRYASVACGADAERSDARPEGAQQSSLGSHATPGRAAEPAQQARFAGRSRVQAVRAARRAHQRRRQRRCDHRLHQDRGLSARRRDAAVHGLAPQAEHVRRYHRDRYFRPHAQRPGADARDGAPAPRQLCRAGGLVGDTGHFSDRLPAGRSDERHQCRYAWHPGGDPCAGADAVDARDRAPHEAAHDRARGNRVAGDRQQSRRRGAHRAKTRRRRLFGRRRGDHGQQPTLQRTVPLAAKARDRAGGSDARGAARRVSAEQAPTHERRADVAEDRLRASP